MRWLLAIVALGFLVGAIIVIRLFYPAEIDQSSVARTDPVHLSMGQAELNAGPEMIGPDGKVHRTPPPKYDYVAGQIIIKFDATAGEEIRVQVERNVAFANLAFPPAIAALNKKYGAHAIRPLFKFDVSPAAMQASRTRVLRERARRRGLPEPKIEAVPMARLDHMFILEFDARFDAASVALDYGRTPGVELASPNSITHIAAEEFQSQQWPLENMHVYQPSGGPRIPSVTGQTIVVAVLDTGVDFCQDDLRGRVIPAQPSSGPCNPATGLDIISPSGPPNTIAPGNDPNGHGTHVAGIVAATDHATPTEIGMLGVAPEVTLIPIRILDATGHGTLSDAANGIAQAASTFGVDIINNSWGAAGPFSSVVDASVESVASQYDVLVVSAAGNDRQNTCGFHPSASEFGMSVSALNQAGDFAYSYSNAGVKIDVGAPGGEGSPPTQVFSTLPATSTQGPPDATSSLATGTGTYKHLMGTSMAAPHISGLAALFMQQNPSYTHEEIQQLIRKTSTANPSWWFPPTNVLVGFGRGDAANVVTAPPLGWVASLTDPYNCKLVQGQIQAWGMADAPSHPGATHSLLKHAITVTPYFPIVFQNLPYSNLSIIDAAATVAVPAPTPSALADWDTVSVPDGNYIVRLYVEDNGGQTAVDYNQVTVDNAYLTHPFDYEIYELPTPVPGAIFKNRVAEVLRFETPNPSPCGAHTSMWDEDPTAIPICGVMNDWTQATSDYLYKWKLGVAHGEGVSCGDDPGNTGNLPSAYTLLNSGSLVPGSAYPPKLNPPAVLHAWDITQPQYTDGFYTLCLVAYYSNPSTIAGGIVGNYQTGHVSAGAKTIIIDRMIAKNFPVDVHQPAQALNAAPPWSVKHLLTLKSPKIADLDHDGQKEIVFGTMIYESDGTPRAWWPLPASTPGFGGSNPALVNIAGDANLELVAGDTPNWSAPTVTAYDLAHTVIWTYNVPYTPGVAQRISSIVAGELIPGSGIDIVFTVTTGLWNDSTGRTTLYALRGSDGALLASINTGKHGAPLGQSWSAPTLGNLGDPGGFTEIAVHTTKQLAVYQLLVSTITSSGFDLKFIHGAAATSTSAFPSDGRADPVFADVFRPGLAPNQQEIVLADHVFERNGIAYDLVATPFATPVEAMGTAYPTMGPAGWFGNIPFVFFGQDKKVMGVSVPGYAGPLPFHTDNTVFENDFMLANKPFGPFLNDNPLQGNPIIGDVDGDGKPDILRTTNADRLLGYLEYGPWPTPYPTKLYGNQLWLPNTAPQPTDAFPRYVWDRSYVGRSSAAIDDVDCDLNHTTEVLVAAGGLLYMWKTNAPYVAANNPWPMYEHDIRNTGNAATVLSAADAGACP